MKLMSNIMRRVMIGALAIMITLSSNVFAQSSKPDTAEQSLQQKFPRHNVEEAKRQGEIKSQEWQQKRSEAEALARQYNIPVRMKTPEGRVMELKRFENGRPVYLITHNRIAAETISTDEVWNAPYNLTGNLITMGIWDGGAVRTTHNEFTNRVVQRDGATDLEDHPTHVAGTMIALGNNYEASGMARDAFLDAYDWDNDIGEMYTAPIDLQVSNHSYGEIAGWVWNSSDGNWYWWGDVGISELEDYKFGFYNSTSADLDGMIANSRPYHLVVIAAGNDRNDIGPGPGGFHYVWNGSQWVGSTTTRDPDSGSDGYDRIPGGYATAKNVLTVGAVKDIPNGYSGVGSVVMNEFSSWGPTDDGRIKPDVVANGMELTSCLASGDYDYGEESGTSMAAPGVSGSTALLLQRFNQLNPSEAILASTLKALIIHTADEAGTPGPDFKFGWGLMNTQKAVDVINLNYQEGEGSHIETYTYTGLQRNISIIPNGGEPLMVTICWSDPAGIPPLPNLNSTTKMLVNDLDLKLEAPGGAQHFPYMLNPLNPPQPATTGDNDVDNVEKVVISSPAPGNYTARINHEGILQSSQDFSIIVTGGRIAPPPPQNYNVTVQNSFNGGQVKVDGQFYASGTVFTWPANSQHNLEAFNQDWPAPNNYYRVFQNRWEKDGLFYSSNNPTVITVTANATYKAVFLKRFDFEVTNNFMDGGSGGTIKVNGQPQPAPYFVQIIEGASIQLEAPPQNQTVNGQVVAYNFLKWSDESTLNPRTILPNDHTSITAEYKGHLVSTTSTATAYNNSHKVVVDHIGGWHAVYEDNGQIYYLRSTNNGATWLPEELVSGRFGNVNRYPAITIEPVSPFRISVVWDMEISGVHYFNGRTKPLSGAWEDEFSSLESAFWWGISSPTRPAALRRGDLYILTRSAGVLELYRFNGEELEWLGVIPGSDESSETPAMTASPSYPSGLLYFAGEQRNQVYFSYFLPPGTFGAAEEVTVPRADIEINRQPSISYSYAATNPINVAWSGFDTDLNAYVLLHRQRSSNLYGQWGSLNEVYYSYSNLSHPSIGSFFDIPFPGWLDVGLKFGNNSLRVIQYNGQGWRWVSGLLPGSHPSLNDQGDSLMLVGTDNTTPLPYRVTSQPFTPVQWEEEGPSGESPLAFSPGKAIPAGENTLPAEIEKRFRKEIFQLSNLPGLTLRGKADIAIGDLQIQTADSSLAWPFTTLTDTTRRKTFLQSEPLLVSGDMQSLTLHYRARVRELQRSGTVPNLPLFRLRLMDAESGAPLTVLRMVGLSQLTGTQFVAGGFADRQFAALPGPTNSAANADRLPPVSRSRAGRGTGEPLCVL